MFVYDFKVNNLFFLFCKIKNKKMFKFQVSQSKVIVSHIYSAHIFILLHLARNNNYQSSEEMLMYLRVRIHLLCFFYYTNMSRMVQNTLIIGIYYTTIRLHCCTWSHLLFHNFLHNDNGTHKLIRSKNIFHKQCDTFRCQFKLLIRV